MNTFLRYLTLLFISAMVVSCSPGEKKAVSVGKTAMAKSTKAKVVQTKAEWKAELSSRQFNILREKGTEAAFSGAYNGHKKDGLYVCAACGNPLFDSTTKFDSGTGWPSYNAPVSNTHVSEVADKSYGMSRVEATCSRCDSHLGHLFNDGPAPTGQRWCINSASLRFRDRASLATEDLKAKK